MRETVSQEDGKQSSVGARARPRPATKVHAPGAQGAAASLLGLQRTHGNRYVQRLISRAEDERERGGKVKGGEEAPPAVQEAIEQARGGGRRGRPRAGRSD